MHVTSWARALGKLCERALQTWLSPLACALALAAGAMPNPLRISVHCHWVFGVEECRHQRWTLHPFIHAPVLEAFDAGDCQASPCYVGLQVLS